jgi:signal transduction histidine kinase
MKTESTCPLTVYQYSHRSFLIFCFGATYYVGYIIVWLVRSVPYLGTDSPEWAVGFVAAVLRFLAVVFMWVIWAYKSNCNSHHVRLLLRWLESAYHPLFALSLALRVGTEVVVGQCSTTFVISEYETACNDFQNVNSVRPNYIVTLMVIPLLAYFLIRDTRAESILISWWIAVGTLIFCSVYMKSQVLIYPITTYVFSSLMIFYDANRQNNDMLKLVTALQATAEEVERLQEKSRATELRAMIGNVAHDLKTVRNVLKHHFTAGA